ncbi:MAG TPA: RNA-binding protein [Terriglobales bacterium]|jgi:RNA recognition motif-containing protein|nr:RNA-binding protein [Terriglobales bacterium]
MKKIFVGNLSFNMTDGELRSMFEPYGSVESVLIVTDRNTGRSRGFGFVEMSDNTAADQAIAALNGKDQGGRTLTVNEARPKMDRGGPRGGGGGGRRDDYRGHARQPREPRW